MLKFFAGLTACFVVLCAGYAIAARNAAGTMSAINGPYQSGQVISSSIVNARLADIEAELTDSKSRSGKGDFTAPVRAADGSVSAPAYAYTSETGSGPYRIGAGDLGWSLLGTKKLELTASLLTVVPDATLFNSTVKMRLDGTTMGGGLAGIWAGAGASSPTSSNYIIAADGAGNTSINSATTINLNIAGAANTKVTSAGLTIGASGTAASNVVFGGCVTSGGGVATCTMTAPSGGKCVCTIVSTGGIAKCTANVVGTTATLYSDVAATASAICWN